MIRSRRTELGLKPDQVADLAQITPRTLNGIETGHGNPTWHVAKSLARALGWTMIDLAEHEHEHERTT